MIGRFFARQGFARSLAIAALSLLSLVLLGERWARADAVEVELRSSAFWEPSASSKLLVINPALSVVGVPSDWLKINAGYAADIVSGASESVKAGRLGGVDVISAATSFHDTRHEFTGGFTITREATDLSASYGYGTESDYRSHSLTVSAGTTFLQKNTELRLSYGRGFDRVCTSHFANADAPSSRLPLDSSKGCFTKADNRDSRHVDLDTFQTTWTQTWTPVLITQLSITGGLQHGFLANPYRGVVIAAAGDVALENHPENRARVGAELRTRFYARGIRTAFGLGLHLYRDTWDILGRTFELDAERYLFPGLRVQARARYYAQSAALFYSDDYTGGEPVDGPRGQYWTGDRELSSLSSYAIGGRIVYSKRAEPTRRLLGAFLGLSASFGMDLMKTNLSNFTWGGVKPDDTMGLLGSLALSGAF
jgi:hypothetical protein